MRTITSISPIVKKYETAGSFPIKIWGNDMEYYICKYPHYAGDFRLVNEYLGNRFAQLWGIPVPEMVLVSLSREHIPEEMLGGGLTYTNLERPLLGFGEIADVVEVMDKFSFGISTNDLKKYDKAAFLTIALFDIWLANDDRNTNNMNLLLKLADDVIETVAIDHEKIFNTGDLTRPIYEQTHEDSILYSNLAHRLFKKSAATGQLINDICASLHNNCTTCNENIEEIARDIPDEWGVDKDQLTDRLHRNIFSDAWIASVNDTFRNFMSLTLLNP
jgi:hypothetical protein